MTLAAALRCNDAIGKRARLFTFLALCDALILVHSITLWGQVLGGLDQTRSSGMDLLLLAGPFVLVPSAATGVLLDSFLTNGGSLTATRVARSVLLFGSMSALEFVFTATALSAYVDPLVGITLLVYLLRHERPWRLDG